MRNTRTLVLIVSVLLVSLLPVQESFAASYPDYDLPLCPPGLYLEDPQDCLPLGPSQTIKALYEQGLPWPDEPFPAIQIDASMSELPVSVARISHGGQVPVWRSAIDAIGGAPPIRYLAAGPMKYVSMVNQTSSDGRVLVQMESGEWVEAEPLYSWSQLRGLEFSRTPKTDFGWTVNPTPSYTGPGYKYPQTGNNYDKFHSFQVYKVEQADDYDWFMIAADEWLPSLKARRVIVDPTRPEGVEGDRWINIDLDEQVVTVWEDGELVFASLLASGFEPFYTQPGSFQIYKKFETITMQDAYEADRSDFYYLQAVPWALFYDRATAIHGVYWPVMLGFPQSHGCVNMSVADAHWLYAWAEEGDWVHVWDRSGNTPLESPLYAGENIDFPEDD